MERDGVLRFYSVSHNRQFKKADCFVLTYNGEVWLIDGGVSGSTHALGFLLELRRKLYSKNKQNFFDTDAKLKVNIFISHFHGDHVDALIESVLPSPYIDIGKVFCSQPSYADEKFSDPLKNGDFHQRRILRSILDSNHPNHTFTEIPFGAENVTSFTTETDSEYEVAFTLYPMLFSPAKESYLLHMFELYGADSEGIKKHTYTYALNAASLWLHVRHKENTFLFTGDSMKRREDSTDESCDLMHSTYRDKIGEVTVLKYVHHGYVRDAAAHLMASFNPKYLLETSELSTGCKAVAERYPDAEIIYVNSSLQSKLFSSFPNGHITLEDF